MASSLSFFVEKIRYLALLAQMDSRHISINIRIQRWIIRGLVDVRDCEFAYEEGYPGRKEGELIARGVHSHTWIGTSIFVLNLNLKKDCDLIIKSEITTRNIYANSCRISFTSLHVTLANDHFGK